MKKLVFILFAFIFVNTSFSQTKGAKINAQDSIPKIRR